MTGAVYNTMTAGRVAWICLLYLRTICTLHVCDRVRKQLDVTSLGIKPANKVASANVEEHSSSNKLIRAVTSVRCLSQQLL